MLDHVRDSFVYNVPGVNEYEIEVIHLNYHYPIFYLISNYALLTMQSWKMHDLRCIVKLFVHMRKADVQISAEIYTLKLL